jgi:transcriptional regulator with XRE-family HTH domain
LPDRGLVRSQRAYCPVHLLEWRRDDKPAYEPLLWQLRPVTVCPDHGQLVRLETRCPKSGCRTERSIVTANAVPGMCDRCGTDLSSATPDIVSESAAAEWERWVAVELGGLVAALASVTEPPSGAAIPGCVQLAITRSGLNLTDYAKEIGVALSTVSLWKDGRRQPSIDGVLRLCRFAGFHVAGFLLGRVAALEAAPMPASAPVVPKAASTYHDIDWVAFRRALRRALRDVSRPSPMVIARRWNVNDRYARRRFPELWRQLSARSQERLRQDAAECSRGRKQVVLDVVQAIHDEGRFPSAGGVKKRLPRRIDFRDPEVVVAWRRGIERLGYRRRPQKMAA